MDGSVIFTNEVQLENERFPINVTDSGIVIFFNEIQSQNALSLIIVNDGGSVIFTKNLQSSNAFFPIFVMNDGITISLTLLLPNEFLQNLILLSVNNKLMISLFAHLNPLLNILFGRLQLTSIFLSDNKYFTIS